MSRVEEALCEVLCVFEHSVSGPLVTLPAESEQVVGLSKQHSAPTREIERIAGHLIAEVVDVEHKLFRQVACVAENKPAKARIH